MNIFRKVAGLSLVGFGVAIGGCDVGDRSSSDMNDAFGESALVGMVDDVESIDSGMLLKKATLEDSFVFIDACKYDEPIDKQIREYGGGERGRAKVAAHIAEIKSSWIDLAYEHRKSDEVIPAEAYLTIARENGAKHEAFYDGHTNQIDEDVVAAQAKIGEVSTMYFRKILKANEGEVDNKNFTQQHYDMVRASFSEDEYEEYYKDLTVAVSEYYGALHDTLGWLKGVGEPKINAMRENSLKHYEAIKEKVYPKELSGSKR